MIELRLNLNGKYNRNPAANQGLSKTVKPVTTGFNEMGCWLFAAESVVPGWSKCQ
jgi:hypothetical protein